MAATTLPRQFFVDVKNLLERLDTPMALGRACAAAVSAPLPSLDDIRVLLEVLGFRFPMCCYARYLPAVPQSGDIPNCCVEPVRLIQPFALQ